MAAVEITNVIPSSTQEQDDAWLYGDAGKDPSQSTLDANATEFISKVQNGNTTNNNRDNSDDETDSDDDDDVQITIREISKTAPGPFGQPYQPPQIQPISAHKTVSVITAPPPTISTSQPVMVTSKRTIDVNAVGNINGVPIYDYDIDTMCEEKPWRIPGADMTDYFNYGFNEESWKAYCNKQKGVRQIATEKNKELGISTVQRVMPDSRPLPELPKLPRVGGTIDVLGSKKESGVPHPISSLSSMMPMQQHRPLMLPHGGLMFPHALPQPTFLPPPTLAPPGLAPPPEMRHEIKQENGTKGPLPPPGMFPPPGMPSMLPPPGSLVPPMLLPPPNFSDDSGASSDDEDRRRRRRSHSRERKRSRERRTRDHRERSTEHRRSRRSPRKEKKSRKSSRADDSSRHRHSRRGDEERSKRSRRKKDGENEENAENGVEETEQ